MLSEYAERSLVSAPNEAFEATQDIDTGLKSLIYIALFYGIPVDEAQLLHEFQIDTHLFSVVEVLLAAKKLGIIAKQVTISPERLETTPLPAIAIDNNGKYFVIAKLSEEKVLLQNPIDKSPSVISRNALYEIWNGHLILCTTRAAWTGDLAKFDFTWFIPAIVKYRKLLTEVLLVSCVIQLFALITPLFFQVIMDKVLVHHGFTTLDVIAIGLLAVTIFEVLLIAMRAYVFSHTTTRIDVELGAKLFKHLLALPLAYFQARRVGDSVARVCELEKIRGFLTGNAITLIMDLLFSIIFLSLMFYYSRVLTLIVALSLPIYVLISVLFTPILRIRLNEKFRRSAENQAFLVESIHGIDTIKSMAVEPVWSRKWDNQLASYVTAGFNASNIANMVNSGVNLVGKLVTVCTLYFGAKLVIGGQLTVGQLIAFNMLAGHVSAPVMRLAQLWTDFQETGISVQRLGDILNSKPEITANKSVMPSLRGSIQFKNVTFRYQPDSSTILRDFNFLIKPGEVIGIVGRSGSGKSTLTKLVQRLYALEQGQILIDGMDIAMVDIASLRRQIGVVLQDNILFNRSIRENIALTEPGCALEKVIQVAKLAGAHEFIAALPEGYDTVVGEHGATLSGGQRQRIAIARALISSPRILIFDEATSALDYESERIIQNNMQAISRGRTVLIIAHRLSAVRQANRIIVLEKGKIVESGSHSELIQNEIGLYARLFKMQQE